MTHYTFLVFDSIASQSWSDRGLAGLTHGGAPVRSVYASGTAAKRPSSNYGNLTFIGQGGADRPSRTWPLRLLVFSWHRHEVLSLAQPQVFRQILHALGHPQDIGSHAGYG